jgi:hypothetical protein
MKLVRHGILRAARVIALLAAVFLLSSSLAVAGHGGGHGGWGAYGASGSHGHYGHHNTYIYGGGSWWDYPYNYYSSPYGAYPGFGGFGGSRGFGGFDQGNDSGGYWIENGAQYLWIPQGW